MRGKDKTELDPEFLLAILEESFDVSSANFRSKWVQLKPSPDCFAYIKVCHLRGSPQNGGCYAALKSYSFTLPVE